MRILKICFLQLLFLLLTTTSNSFASSTIERFEYEYNGNRYRTKKIEFPADLRDCVSFSPYSVLRNGGEVKSLPNCDEQKMKLFEAFKKRAIDSEIAILKNADLKKQEDKKNWVNYNNERVISLCVRNVVSHTYMIEKVAINANVHPKTVELKEFGLYETDGFKKCSAKFYHSSGISMLELYYPNIGKDYEIYTRHLNSKLEFYPKSYIYTPYLAR